MAQEEDTKKYLFKMLQNQSGYSLPMGILILKSSSLSHSHILINFILGPVLFSPFSFITGLIAEVVTKSPDVQKTKVTDKPLSVLADIHCPAADDPGGVVRLLRLQPHGHQPDGARLLRRQGD